MWSHLTLATWWNVNGTEFWICFSQSAVVVNRRCTSPVLSKASPPSGIKIQWIIQHTLFPTQPLKRKWKCITFPWKPRRLLSFPWAHCAYITFKMKILFMWRGWSQGRPDGHFSGLGIILKLKGTLSWFNGIPLILHLLSPFIHFPVLETFISCADQTVIGFCGEMLYLKICDPRGREKEFVFRFSNIWKTWLFISLGFCLSLL